MLQNTGCLYGYGGSQAYWQVIVMRLDEDRREINYLGEFSDHALEKEFFGQYMGRAMRYLRPLVIFLGILNTLFVIPDFFLVSNRKMFAVIAAARLVYAGLTGIFAFRIKQMEKNKSLAMRVTLMETGAVILFLFVFYQYQTPDYLIQAMGVIVILIALFMVPNRWVNAAGASAILGITFPLVSAIYIKDLKASVFWAGFVYILIIVILLSIVSFRNNISERVQYLNQQELIRLSTTDPLSGAYNRIKLDQEMKKWVEYAKRYAVPLSVAIIDFDDFKKINDTFGHLIGDNVIAESSAIIKEIIRKSDVFARWGGEEFILLLPNTAIKGAFDLTERIRNHIGNHVFTNRVKVTCSIGVAQLCTGDDSVSLFRKADMALYAAKEKGKNKVITKNGG